MKKIGMGLALLAGLTACGRSPETVSGTQEVAASAGTVLPDSVDETRTAYARASQALAEQRMMSPAGDNAIEHYLAARADMAEADRAQAALAELQPYVLIAAEQALARSDAVEAERLRGSSSASMRAHPRCPACARASRRCSANRQRRPRSPRWRRRHPR